VRDFAGILNTSHGSAAAKPELPSMIGMLLHRGPNDYSYSVDVVAWFWHARLRISDFEDGRPFIYNEDKTLLHVFIG
jgi:asparagine synthetase B (glutamine-hydrolysing)